MKKIVYTLLLSLTLSSCSNDKDIVLEDYDSNKKDLVNEKRSYGEIINIARSVISVEVDKSTRGEVCGSVSIYPLIGNNTRTESDTLLYAVDFDDSEGFAIISAYKSITPVLAVIEQGSFASEETTSNSGFQYALEKAINYASDTKNANMLPELPKPLIPTKWYEYSDTIFPRRKINPRIKINLNQKWPENQLCPNLLAGCAPIAAFQIMAGLRQPLHLEYTYPGHTLEYEAIDWNNLNKHTFSLDTKFPTQLEINNHLNNCGLNESEHLVLSRIAREIGHRANADYSSPMITSTGYEIIDALERTIGKSKSKSGSDANTLFEDLYKKNKSVAH